MDFTYLQANQQKLLDYLINDGYTKSYIRRVKENILWILKNEKGKPWQNYLDIYQDRVRKSESKLYKKTRGKHSARYSSSPYMGNTQTEK